MSKKKIAYRQALKTGAVSIPAAKQIKSVSDHSSMPYWFAALLLVLPVIFSREAQDPALTPRYILLSIFIFLFILYFYALKKTVTRLPYLPLIKYIFLAAIIFTAWSIVGLFFSVNPTAGYYEILRQLLTIILLFLITEMISANESYILKLCKVFVVIGIFQSFVGILQFYDIGFREIPGANAKPFGLMANRNLFGSAQALVIPFVIYVLYRASSKWKYASVLSLLLVIVSLILSQTRAAWLAAMAIIIVALLLVLIFSASNRKKWLTGTIISIVTIFCTGALLIATDKEGDLSKQVKERTVSLINAAGDSTQSNLNANDRLGIWRKTITLIKDNPVKGVGTGNWKLNILSYGSAGLSWSAGYYVPDRVHNVYLQTAAETGMVGAMLYIIFWILITIAGFMVIIKPASEDQRILVILMLGGLAAFATDSMFSFPTERIEHTLYVMLMAGVILGNYIANKKNALVSTRLPKAILTGFLVIAFINFMMGIKKHAFEKNLKYAIAYDGEGRYPEVQAYAEAGKNSWVNVDQLGQSLEARNGVAFRAQKNYPLALEKMNLAMKYNPNSSMVYNNLGTIYTEMTDFKKAIPYYEQALKLTPDFVIVKKNLAYNYFQVGNYKGTVKTLENVKIADDEFLVNLLKDAQRLAVNQP